MEEFFEKGTLPPEHMIEGMREAVAEHRLYPVLCASALHNIGTDRVLDFIVDNVPAPTDRPAVKGDADGTEVERPISDDQPPAAFVFKTAADVFAGRVSYFKVLSGVVKNDANLSNSRSPLRRAAGAHWMLTGQRDQAHHRVARRRHRRRCQVEGYAHR